MSSSTGAPINSEPITTMATSTSQPITSPSTASQVTPSLAPGVAAAPTSVPEQPGPATTTESATDPKNAATDEPRAQSSASNPGGTDPATTTATTTTTDPGSTATECDSSRSVAVKKTGSSGSRKGAREQTHTPEEDEKDLLSVWRELILNWEVEVKKRPNHIKELVKKGIPQHFRMIAWQHLSNASVSSVHDLYSDYMRQSSVYEKVIQRDIPRTYPELDFFKDGERGQSLLFNVIKAYSVHDKEVGYCQGSAFIVGLLLLQMPEEEAFAVLVSLMENYRLRELYKPTMTDLGLCMFQLECLVQDQMPDLYTHFNNMGFDTSMYASSWFLTLFTTTMPLDIANRIMDCFLVEGMDYIFCISIAILQQARIELLRLDMDGLLKYFQREVRKRYENDADLLFAVANQVQLDAKQMKQLETDYIAKRTNEQKKAARVLKAARERERLQSLLQEGAPSQHKMSSRRGIHQQRFTKYLEDYRLERLDVKLPEKDEVEIWKKSVTVAIDSILFCAVFQPYLEERNRGNILAFYEAIKQFTERKPAEQRKAEAKILWNQFLCDHDQTLVDGNTREMIIESLRKGKATKSMFNDAKEQVRKALGKEHAQFLRTAPFTELDAVFH